MYNEFADFYDILMKETDYLSWADFYEKIFSLYNIKPRLVLDLGCGTGTLTEIMAERGYDMTGIDSSCAMLGKAIEKRKNDILYLNQSMTEFELYGTMGAIISGLDCINYITEEKELLKTFKLTHNYLDYDGVLVFDINSRYKLENILGGNCYTYDSDGIFYTWESFYDKETKLCDFELKFFIEETDGRYSRFDEYQTERGWSTSEISELLKDAGFCEIKAFGDRRLTEPKENEERIFIAARKKK